LSIEKRRRRRRRGRGRRGRRRKKKGGVRNLPSPHGVENEIPDLAFLLVLLLL
jgi:hypothetical protein